MSAASESFSACQAIEEGRWDRHLVEIGLVLRQRLRVIEQAKSVVGEETRACLDAQLATAPELDKPRRDAIGRLLTSDGE